MCAGVIRQLQEDNLLSHSQEVDRYLDTSLSKIKGLLIFKD